MFLVLILGGGFGWVVHRARVQRDAVAAIEKAGGSVVYRWSWQRGQTVKNDAPSGWPRWLVNALGPDYFGDVVSVSFRAPNHRPDDALLAHIGRLGHLEGLDLEDCREIMDAGLAHLRGLVRLRQLNLRNTGVRGSGLTNLRKMYRLEGLNVLFIPVVDADLAPIAGLHALKGLCLSGERLTNAGLAHLAQLTNLKVLEVRGGPISSKGLAHLRDLRHLRILKLWGTQIERLDPLQPLTSLEGLILINTPITDNGLVPIAYFRNLEQLELADTRITDAGLVPIPFNGA